MEFSRRSRLRLEDEFNEDAALEGLICHNVALYLLPPMVDLAIEDFETLALERLKVLRILEQATAKNVKIGSDEGRESILNEMNHAELKAYARLCSGNRNTDLDMEARRRDYVSHFILRFAYCRSEELRRWFVTREMELFRLKFSGLSSQDVADFIEDFDMDYTPLTADERAEVKEGLYDSTGYQTVSQIDTMDFYKVPFTDVLDLVRGQRCYLKEGYAYVSAGDFVSVIGNKHQELLEEGLQAHLRLLPELENDERFASLLKGLHTSYTGKDYTIAKNGEVPIESLDQLSKKSFPLCMRMCHDTLRSTHHHRHGGRMQYGLFLKGIGVTLEDSLRFWREEFTRGTVALDKFEKDYAYNIRHNYGKEGSRVNYTPYSCMKIIMSSVGPTDTHGCPFKIWDPSVLQTKLGSYGLGAAHAEEIAGFVSKGHYQVACSKYFEVSHGLPLEEGINHPNQYFELSQIKMGARAAPAKPKPTPSRRPVNHNGTASQQDETMLDTQDTEALNEDDDDELWQLMENKESGAEPKPVKQQQNGHVPEKVELEGIKPLNGAVAAALHWEDDEDFDVSQMETE
uniref:DNA primase large subunit n=1 Tax=Culex pipiens TaxID=7175 RepID=A0A8D8PA49_CULPI